MRGSGLTFDMSNVRPDSDTNFALAHSAPHSSNVIASQSKMILLTDKQQELYDSFYESTHNNEHIDSKTELLVGLAAAMAMNCNPCTSYYLKEAKKANISKGQISEVLAKVMAVAAGQKRLQLQEVIGKHGIDLQSVE